MGFRVGSVEPTGLYVGDAAVTGVYLGAIQVWPAAASGATFEDTVLATSPDVFYRMKDTGGTVAVNSGSLGEPGDGVIAPTGDPPNYIGYAQPGVVPNDPDSKSVQAKIGTANSGPKVTTPVLASVDDFTIMLAWRGTDDGILFRHNGADATFIRTDTTNISGRVVNTDFSTATPSTTVTDGNDHLFILTQDRSAGFSLYVDSGTPIHTGGPANNALGSATLDFMKNQVDDTPVGHYSEFGVWLGAALSPAEVDGVCAAWSGA